MIPLLAPILAELAKNGLGILANAITAKGKEVVEEKLGVKIPDAGLSPELALQLKSLEFQHEQWLLDAGIRQAQQGLEETKAQLADVQDARKMQGSALAQDDLFSKRFIYYFATAIFVFCAVYVTAITFLEIPKENVRFADTILGFLLGTFMATLINFFYGTSQKSSTQTSVISTLTDAVTSNRRGKGSQP